MDEELELTPKRVVPGLVPLTEEEYAAEYDVRMDREANEGGFADSVQRTFRSGDNFAYQVFKRLERERDAPADVPGHDPNVFIDRNKDRIPGEYQQSFMHSGSPEEDQMIFRDMQSELHDRDILSRRGGISTFVASGLAGLIDIDTPLALMSGGASIAVKASRWGNVARGAVAGGATQAGIATVGTEADTVGDWAMIPLAGLTGMGFGMVGGAFSRGASARPEHSANEAIDRVGREFAETVEEGAPLAARDIRNESFGADDVYGSVRAEREAAEAAEASTTPAAPQSFSLDEVDVAPESIGELRGGATVGAQQLNPQGSIANIVDKRSLDMVQDAQTWARTSGVPGDYHADNGNLALKGQVGAGVANAARRFHDGVTASPLVNDFDRLFRSGSVVAQKLAYDAFESAAGIVRNNRSASMLKDYYERKLLGTFMPAYQAGYTAWSRSRGNSKMTQVFSGAERDRFNREVLAELNGRAFDPPGTQRAVNPAVKDVADAHDMWSAADIEVGRGRPGEHAIKGYENLKAYSGYFSQKWSGSKINKMIHSGAVSRNGIRDAIAEGYVAKHSVAPADAQIWAEAVMRRAMASDRGTDMNLIGILQQDGRGFLEEMLTQAGHNQSAVDKLMDRLTGSMEKRGQQGHTKGRTDIDLRFVSQAGINIMDLVETDIARTVSRRARGTSGSAALARKGIRSKQDRQSIIDAILHEQQARGNSQPTGSIVQDAIDGDKHLTADDLHDLFSYFDAGPIAGGVSPVFSRIKKLTNLALLNQLGLTQMAELGAQISSVGMTRWAAHAGEAFNAALRKPDSPLHAELKHLDVMVAEERLFRDDFAIDMDRIGTPASEFMQKFDNLLNTGQRVQGYMSGFYAARKFQQRVAVSSAADKIMTNMKGTASDLSQMRAADIGLDPTTFARIKQYVDNGTVEFDPASGNLFKLNLDKWEPIDAEDFALSLNRHVHQVVQRAMAGESSFLFHKDGAASLFFHLKAFPMLAMQKQAGRNIRMGDAEAMYSFLFGLATAGSVYSIRQVINGREQNLTPDKIARGAIGLSNMSGWLPMWTDPVASMFGMDSLKFNTYNQGIEGNVLSTPAALPTLNKMANIPGALLSPVTGGITNSDIRALQAAPIIGNAYGMTAIFNAMKD